MLKQRRYNADLVALQLTVRQEMLRHLFELDEGNLLPVLAREAQVLSSLTQLEAAAQGKADSVFFANYQFLVRALYHLVRGSHLELHAEVGAEVQFRAVRACLRRIQVEAAGYPEPFKNQLLAFMGLLASAPDTGDVEAVAQAFCRLAFPARYVFETDPLAELRQQVAVEPQTPEELPLLLSVEFELGNEPWANPQVLRPALTYTVQGTLTPNYWPEGYERLVLMPMSTALGAFYELELPAVLQRAEAVRYELTGHVAFRFPQSNFDEALAIRLLAYYENAQAERLYPALIGYDQLIAQVVDPSVVRFPTGFRAMNALVLNIKTAIHQQLPQLDPQELEDFSLLLSGIVNYQGFCLQQGVYKEQDKVSEDDFRDNLIQHLVGLPYIGEHINKEAHLAGGRVEVGFHGIVAELKVEKTIADRGKLQAKYGQQAVAYAAGNTKQLSILCVLDLTNKVHAPAPPQNNVLLYTPPVHGFAADELAYPVRQVLVIVEGNTRKPSDYSR